MRLIKVYGSLAKFLGQRSFRAAVSTPAEAVRFLVANFPGLQAHMAEREYKVSAGRIQLPIGDEPQQLHMPIGSADVIRIVPVLIGAGDVGKILGGIALVALSLLFAPGAALATSLGFTLGSQAVSIGVGIGLSLTLGGVASLLSPVPQLGAGNDTDADPKKSYSFSGIQNVSRSGVPVPIIYGEVLVGSVVISAGLTSNEVVTVD
jgi:predicted phage tail protein